jgi:hypothetical protein
MNDSGEGESKIIVDEDWKSKVEAEKEALKHVADAPAASATASASATTPSEPPREMQLPPASIETLVSMLATQASIELGQGADPKTENAREHFAIAKHFVDLLGVVEEKTKGNLTPDEAKMLDAVLHDLRMAYIRMRP